MTRFSTWDVVAVPFPFADRAVRRSRPAVVVSADTLEEKNGQIWVTMITSALNTRWDGDVTVNDLAAAGLPAESVVRPAKIATIDARQARRIGALDNAARGAVEDRLRDLAGF